MATGRRFRLHMSTVLVMLIGGALTVGLSLSARAVHNNNEDRLLRERVREAGLLISSALPSVETPLASAAEVAEATNANREAFTRVMAPLVGPNGEYASASIWPLDANPPKPALVIGGQPELDKQTPSEIRALLTKASHSPQLTVVGLLDAPQPRVA